MDTKPSSFEDFLKLLGVLGAVASFIWGVWVWRDKSHKELDQQIREAKQLAESRRVEATKPFLERQLKLYTEASQVAATIATSDNSAEVKKATKRFWELYWGELALVENKEVESAMVKLGEAMGANNNQNALKGLSLELARACRYSLDKSWGIHAWVNPDEAAGKIDTRKH